MRQPTKSDEHKGQTQKFIDKARELGTDDDEGGFEDKLKRLVPRKGPVTNKDDKGQ